MSSTAVVVGASIGGVRTVQGLRSAGFDGEIVLVGAEPVLPYDKPPLSKALLAGTAAADPLLTAAAAAELDVVLRLGSPAGRLDLSSRQVELADGAVLPYGHLVIATGADARPSPWGAGHVLRTLADAEALRADLLGGGPLVVIGAGFVGAEVAATARGMGVEEVTLVDPVPVPMSRSLNPEVAERLAGLHRANGVHTRFGTGVTGVTRQGSDGFSVALADGTALPARVVVVGIGAVPSTGWLAGSGLKLDDGVVCDPYCAAVGAPGVWAVGDVARWQHPRHDRLVRLEHWTNAVEQAGCVAHNITHPADPRAHDPVEYVWSDQYDWKIQLTGRTGDARTGVTVDGPRGFAVLYADPGGLLAGAVTVNWPKALITARRALAAGNTADATRATLTG